MRIEDSRKAPVGDSTGHRARDGEVRAAWKIDIQSLCNKLVGWRGEDGVVIVVCERGLRLGFDLRFG